MFSSRIFRSSTFGIALGILCSYAAWAQAAQSDEQQLLAVRAGDALPCPTYSENPMLAPNKFNRGLVFDGANNLYFTTAHCVFRLEESGVITRVAGGGAPAGGPIPKSGRAVDAALEPADLWVDADSALLIISAGEIFRVTPDGSIAAMLRHCDKGPHCASDVVASGLAEDQKGNLYVSDSLGNRVIKMAADGVVTTLVSNDALRSGDPRGVPFGNQSEPPAALALARNGDIYVTDTENSRVREVTLDGSVSTVAGYWQGFSGDGGPARLAAMAGPVGIAVDLEGSLYIADSANERVRKVNPSGIISTAANLWEPPPYVCHNGEKCPTLRSMVDAVAVDKLGNIFVIDGRHQQLKEILTSGEVKTVGTLTVAVQQ